MSPSDIYLIVLVVGLAFILLLSIVLFLVKFAHPDDKNVAMFPKTIIVSGLWLAAASILVLPFDIANIRSDFRIDVLWEALFIVTSIYVFGLIPYAYFFYESDSDPDEREGCLFSQTGRALMYTIVLFILFAVATLIMYAFLGTAEIPFTSMQQTLATVYEVSEGGILAEKGVPRGCGRNCASSVATWVVPVTMPVYIMAVLAFLGWFFFAIFVGVGLMALPMDLINEYRTRPLPMKTADWIEERRKLGERASLLLDVGEKMKDLHEKNETRSRSQKRKDKKNMLKFEQHFYFLKKDYEILNVAYQLKGGNPVWYFFKLILGCISILISFSWILHIILFMLPAVPFHDFLNSFFITLEDAFGGSFKLFGIIAYAIWSMYLLWACVKGNLKLGLRFIIWRVYPLEINKTLMNAFLVNTWLILICSVPIVQFSVQAFPVYARFTEVDMLFGTQVQYLKFFKIFWVNDIFVIAILAVAFITMVGLLVYPVDRAQQINEELEKVKSKPNRV